MPPKSILHGLILAVVCCQAEIIPPKASRETRPEPQVQTQPRQSKQTVYQVVLEHLFESEERKHRSSLLTPVARKKIVVDPSFCKGDSLVYPWGEKIAVGEKLKHALKLANKDVAEFKQSDFKMSMVKFEELKPFRVEQSEKESRRPECVLCWIQFWQAGYSDDGNRAVVRFYYGQTPHGAAGTYLLERTTTGWEVIDSVISYYL